MMPFGPLAITADDYGLTDGINEGITSLARRQAITGVSVMCHPAARLEQTAALKNTGVLTGVHLVLVEERPVLEDDRGLQPILDRRGRLPDHAFRLFAKVLQKPWVLSAIKREAEAQINRFVDSGLSLDFINSHQHVHLFPPIWLVLRPLLESYKVPVRGTARWDWQGWSRQSIVNGSSWLSWRIGPRAGNSLSLKPLGVNSAGRFSVESAKELLASCRSFSRYEVPEIVIHPGCEDRQARDHYAHWRYRWDQERQAMISDVLQTLLEQRGCDLLGASMRIRERVAEATTFSTRLKSSDVALAIVWPQTWEQVVLFSRLAEGLVRKGVGPRLLLPDLMAGLERHQFEHYRGYSLGRRWIDLWFWLRTLKRHIDSGEAVYHLVVPSPAWVWVAGLLGSHGERVLLHYAGRAVAWDKASWGAFIADPWRVGSVMLADPRFLVRLAPWVKVSHLTMDAVTARELTGMGCKKVYHCPGLVSQPGGRRGRPEVKKTGIADASSVYLGFSGMGTPVEGVLDLLRAMAMAVPESPRLRLLMVITDKQRRARVVTTIGKLGLEGHVEIVGIEEEHHLWARVDVMVLPFRAALAAPLYPGVLLDAAAGQCPIITTAIPAWEHLFDLSSPMLEVVSPGDVPALRRALVTFTAKVDRSMTGPSPLKPPSDRQGMEAVSAIHHRLGGGRFLPGSC